MANTQSAHGPAVPPLFTITIGGVKIEMPVRPYPSQISMMDKVIRGCRNQQNCLLESPTGSGKTLALLCSALGWQKAEKDRLEKLSEEEFKQKITEWQLKEQQKNQSKVKQKKPITPEKLPQAGKSGSPAKKKKQCHETVSSDDSEAEMSIFKQPGKKRKPNNNKTLDVFEEINKVNDDFLMTDDSSADNSLITEDEDVEQPQISKMPKKAKVTAPVIYFCTRTHKQIEQVIKELQKTSFNNVKSCVLASREHTCIQDINVNYPDITYKSKTEMCRDLLDPKARRRNVLKFKKKFERCSLYDNGGVSIGSYKQLTSFGMTPVWDVEDIMHLGMSKKSCPYYGTRLLLRTADIVFCPYNYIIDPVIRGTTKMKLQGNVIIVDEAHNIEDQCREAASLKLDQASLNLAKMDCERLSKLGNNSSSFAAMARYLSEMSLWINQKSTDIKSFDDYNRGVISWTGIYTIASFNDFGVGLGNFEKFKKNCELVLDESTEEEVENNRKEEEGGNKEEERMSDELMMNDSEDGNVDDSVGITNATKQILTSICSVLSLFFNDNYKNDYHVSLEKVMELKKFEHEEKAKTHLDGWFNTEAKDSRPVWNNFLSFLCLNSAAVFHELKTAARSIILTSGTLSPIQSFQSELGTLFPIALEANHVIKQDQCWVTTVRTGPTGVDLNAQYQNINTYSFQDEMGQVLKDVCLNVPYGVLCFMPSYQLIEKLCARWQITGLMRELKKIKVVMCEPRRGDQLEQLMNKYYSAIKNANSRGPSGALFIAVYRGKISEGLDFSDNNARAVVAVGIPYPNYKDVYVTHKKDYNDKHHKEKGLLSGWEWYQIQAYRALNQALGRCIRHKNDWGAILLVDSRYTQVKNTIGLSKWIRGRVEHNNPWQTTIARLKHFIESRQQEEALI